MSAESAATSQRASSPESPFCAQLGHCPLCGGPNCCRLETGEAFKGPCWCERPIVDAAALRRLLGDLAAPRCLCSGCLAEVAGNPEVSVETLRCRQDPEPEMATVAGEGDFYWEGNSMVFTAQFHLRRGSCCGSGCRHCPYR